MGKKVKFGYQSFPVLGHTDPKVRRKQPISMPDGTHPEVYRGILYILTCTLGAYRTSRHPHGDLIVFTYESNRLWMSSIQTPSCVKLSLELT